MMRLPVLLFGLCFSTAWAQNEPENRDLSAKAFNYYNEGKAAFQSQQFGQALTKFEQANVLDPSPILVYNIARCHEEMGQAEAAIRYYELYLDVDPQASDREDVERRVRVMKAILQHGSNNSWNLKPWALVTAGVGGAGLLTGIASGLVMHHFEDEQRESTNPQNKADYADKAKSASTIANVGFISGGLFLATGATLFLIDHFKNSPQNSASTAQSQLHLSPLGASFSFTF